MDAPALQRPPRVLTACLFAGALCLALLFESGWALTNWGSMEVQGSIRKALNSDTLKSAGLSIEDVVGWLRWGLMAVAVVAATGVIFAIYTALGHQASRIILSIICVFAGLAFLTLSVVGIVPAAFSIWCAMLLWTPDARRWFAFKNGKYVPSATPAQADPFAAPQSAAPHVVEPQQAHQHTAPPHSQQPAYAPVVAGPRMPGQVLTAGLIALLGSGLVMLICGINALLYSVSKQDYIQMMRDNPLIADAVESSGMTAAGLAEAMFIACCICTVLGVAGAIAAGATLLRARWGRIALLTLSVITAGISLVVPPFGLLMTALAVATIVLLRRPEARAWFAHAR